MKISNRIKTGSPTESFCECVPQKDLQCSCGEDQDGKNFILISFYFQIFFMDKYFIWTHSIIFFFISIVNWAWDNKHLSRQTVLSNCDKDVRFHPGYSSGTAAVRGNVICLPGYHYFWEIKMLTSLYGTDVVSAIRMWTIYFIELII